MGVEIVIGAENLEDIKDCLSCKKYECDNCKSEYFVGTKSKIYYYNGVGYNRKQIADLLKVNRSTVTKYMQKHGEKKGLEKLFEKYGHRIEKGE